MIRLIVAVALAVAAVPGVATAQPTQPAGQLCSYTLTPPQVVNISGTEMVTATVSPAKCNRSTTYLSVACVQVEGNPGPGQCVQNNGILTAQVYFSPYQPGRTYVATGRGCATTGNPPQPVCDPLGPITAAL